MPNFGPIPERPGYYTPEAEAKRKAINQWIRTSRAFDGVIDFEAAVRDPKDPNRLAPAYRLWMGLLKARGTWPLGTEEPFGATELRDLALRGGGRPLPPAYGSFLGSLVNHGVNQALFKLGRRGLPVPHVRLPLVDRLAYELLLPVVRP